MVRALRLWDNLLDALHDAEAAWRLFTGVVIEGRLSPEAFPLEAQRVMARVNPHCAFFVFLERFADFARKNGGFEEMRVKGIKRETTNNTADSVGERKE